MSEADADRTFCQRMLPLVSRTFAACIGLLPEPLRHQVLVAYLLCRIADTVEDCARLDAARKRELLASFRAALDQGGVDPPGLPEAFATPANNDEVLARDAACTLREFRSFPRSVGDAIRPWVQEMSDGMAGFAALQPRPGEFQALERVTDLDRYCWFVAGTVGHLLTGLFRVHSPRITPARYEQLKALATDFGLGLQLVNIIKDVADDRRRGWSFVPRELCATHGLDPEGLLDPVHAGQAQAAMRALIAKARGHLDRAMQYCLALPALDYRIRLFCLAPLLFAVRTLAVAARDQRLLDPGHKVKITRAQVYRTLAMAHVLAPFNPGLRLYVRMLGGRAGGNGSGGKP